MKITNNFRKILEPTFVRTSPRFADRCMMKTADGQLRCYGVRAFQHEDGTREFSYIVLKSDDCGLSFTEEEVAADNAGASTWDPESGYYLTLHTLTDNFQEWPVQSHAAHVAAAVCIQPNKPGVFAFRSTSPDGPWERFQVSEDQDHIQHIPLKLRKRNRWVVAAQRSIDGVYSHWLYISDDNGVTWRKSFMPTPPVADTLQYPHKGLRWVHPGIEPSVTELPSGRLMVLMRTSMDIHYQAFSDDGGETWTAAEPSPFYSTATMPGIYALSDGRVLAIWNNTTPLAEVDHTTQTPTRVLPWLVRGDGEDVFTNRDALHAAISDDEGRSWRGFREIVLNPRRNDSDWRTNNGSWISFDKSVHQNQVIELPENKVLVNYGQHENCAGIMIFDLKFLDARRRSDDFRFGLKDWSTHLYYRSHSGGCICAGHCAWNRRSGAQLVPTGDDDPTESLLIGRHPDARLHSDLEGAVWNFPAAAQAEIRTEMTIVPGSRGIRISLADRWINPSDEHVAEYALFTFQLDGEGKINGVQAAEPGKRFTLTLKYDLESGTASAEVNGTVVTAPVTQSIAPPFGKSFQISYAHFQTLAESADEKGVLLHNIRMSAE
ncbi:MAG: exo-alpha-sialidase [Victivallales bacterium]|nr:exo-alpha-sialidase [Victivallales bacterium]